VAVLVRVEKNRSIGCDDSRAPRSLWLQRIVEIRAGNGFTTPDKIANWARRSGADVPVELMEAIAKRPPMPTAGMSDVEQLRHMIVDKEDEIASLKAELEACRNRPMRGLSTRERSTCLKIIIGMAIRGYRYDPKAPRSDKTSEIAGDLHAVGLSIDVDTVRKWLDEASGMLEDRPVNRGREASQSRAATARASSSARGQGSAFANASDSSR
jgi:hypothetical protein